MYIYISGLLLLLNALQISAIVLEEDTDNTLEYSFYTLYSDIEFYHFQVRAGHDAHLVFTYQNNLTTPYYEIMLGGWDNTKSVIRKNGNDTSVCEAETNNLLSTSEFRSFIVVVGTDKLKVYGDSFDIVLDCDIPGIQSFLYMGIRTSWGATGSWILETVRSKDIGLPYGAMVGQTNDNKTYTFYTLYKETDVYKFQIRAEHDAHVVFTTKRYLTTPRFEVMLGGWGNTKSVIRKNGNETSLCEADTDNLLSANEFRRFSVDRSDGKIRVFRDGDSDPFLEHDAPKMQSVLYMGIRTCWGASGSWILENVRDVATGWYYMQLVQFTNGRSDYYYFRTNGNRLYTNVQAEHDAYIRLIAAPGTTIQYIDIMFGTDQNTKTVIRKNGNNETQCEVDTPNLMRSSIKKYFYLEWSDGALNIKRNKASNSFITCTIPTNLVISFHGIRTGEGVEGEWLMSDDENVNLVNDSGYWVEVDD